MRIIINNITFQKSRFKKPKHNSKKMKRNKNETFQKNKM